MLNTLANISACHACLPTLFFHRTESLFLFVFSELGAGHRNKHSLRHNLKHLHVPFSYSDK